MIRLPLPLIAVAALVQTPALAQDAPDVDAKKNVIMYIGDGFGIAPKTAARLALGQGQPGSRFSDDPDFRLLAIDRLKYSATVTTHSYNGFITDSAPGATCYAAGQNGKIDNDQIAWDPLSQQPVETILEAAKREGYAVGLVTSTRLTHATPADFATHVWSRSLENVIAAQYLASSQEEYAAIYGEDYDTTAHWIFPEVREGVKIDVLMGGGARHFLPADSQRPILDRDGAPVATPEEEEALLSGRRDDSRDLITFAEENLNYQFVNSRDALVNLDLDQFTPDDDRSLLGLFSNSHTSYEQDRQLFAPFEPSLEDMVEIAIEVLKRKSDKGFFLLVEGGRIDHMEHANVGAVRITDAGTAAIVVDTPAFSPDIVYSFDPAAEATRIPGIYGSDYLIKEVLDFDKAIGKGRALLADAAAGETLIFQAADHECGGLTVTGLHDAADFQENGTEVRTYAERPSNSLGQSAAQPGVIDRGDAEIGGWFPEYTLYEFQGESWPTPVDDAARRLVIAYGSNPQTNGNSNPGTPGNHTPDDIYVGADDNVGGQFASQITGRGLLDNTDLTPIMSEFMGLTNVFSTDDASVAVSVEPSDSEVCIYEPISYTITVRNDEVRVADEVSVAIPFTDRAAFVSSTATHGEFFQYGPGAVVIDEWQVGALEPGEAATLTLTIFTLDAGGLTLTATSTGTTEGSSDVAVVGGCPADADEAGDGSPSPGARSELSLMPSVTNAEAQLTVSAERAGPAEVTVIGLDGVVAQRFAWDVDRGENARAVTVAGLSPGSYFVVFAQRGAQPTATALVVE